jgi:TrmH family RNA methyltransferase
MVRDMTGERHASARGNDVKVVTSLQNDRIKAIRALDMRKTRKETGLFVAEGASLIVTAREQGHVPRTLVYRAGSAAEGIAKGLVAWALAQGAEVLEVSEAILEKLAAKDNPQSLLAVFSQRWASPPDPARLEPQTTWVALEEIRDPGNLGTILRSVDAAGAGGVILVGTCCDAFARETIRATMGSVFAVPLVRLDREGFLALCRDWPGDIVGTHLSATADFRTVDYKGPTLLVMGSEGPGLSQALAAACTELVKIPMAGKLDSLNLAVATALTLFQIRAPYLKL